MSDQCEVPGCRNAAFCRSENYHDKLVCRECFRITNGMVTMDLLIELGWIKIPLEFDNHHNAAACPYCRPELNAQKETLRTLTEERDKKQLTVEALTRRLDLEIKRADTAEAAQIEAVSKVPTDAPAGERLLLNAYGRRCYYAGEKDAQEELAQLRRALDAAVRRRDSEPPVVYPQRVVDKLRGDLEQLRRDFEELRNQMRIVPDDAHDRRPVDG